MPRKISPDLQRQIEQAFEDYRREVEASALAEASQHTYLLHAGNFVRWLKGDFEPGARKR